MDRQLYTLDEQLLQTPLVKYEIANSLLMLLINTGFIDKVQANMLDEF